MLVVPKRNCMSSWLLACMPKCTTSEFVLGLTLLVRSPESQVVAKQLHDECGILIRILSNIVELSNGIFEGSTGHLACFIGVAEYLVLEYGKIESKAQANGMSHPM